MLLIECRYFSAMHWILSAEPADNPDLVPTIEDVILSEDFLAAEDKSLYLREKLAVSDSTINSVACATVGQRENPAWSTVHKMRLTASNFGAILHALKTQR